MRKPSTATIIASLALFVSLGGVGVAASGTDFILGRNNTAKAKTSLTAPVAGNALQITNTLPGGSALGLSVDPGSPPFTTNSSTKVPNLNTDLLDGLNSTAFVGVNATAANSNKLDGLDSSQFTRGGGSVSAMHGSTSTPSSSFSQTVLGVFNGPAEPLLKVQGNCADNYAPSGRLVNGASIYLTNVSSVNILRWLDDGGGDPAVDVVVPSEVDGSLPYKVADHAIWHARAGNLTYTLDTWANKDSNLNCHFDLRLTIDP
jgi:hypothetical protein